MERELICADCETVFGSAGLLQKHKGLFCIGSEARCLQVHRHSAGLLSGDKPGCVDPEHTRAPDLAQPRGHHRNTAGGRKVDTKPKSARAEDEAAPGLTESAAQQDLTDEASGRQRGHSQRLKMREMVTEHEHQLDLIRAHSQQLQQQRDELIHQVNVVSEQSSTTHLENLLMELKEQEQRNEETLQQLAQHLFMFHVRDVSVAEDPRPSRKMNPDSYEFISTTDGPLSAQIRALRQAYAQSGGSHPAIVARMIDLQAEAQSLEKNQPAAAGEKMKPPQGALSRELQAVEHENQRLEEEILMFQMARRGRHHNYKAAMTELELIQREKLLQVSSSQAEMEASREAPRPRRRPPPPPLPLQAQTHIHTHPSLVTSSFSPVGGWILDSLDPLSPAPYDPAAGLVVFYDLLLRLDVSQRALRLVAALYSEGHEVGAPTPLPPIQCLPHIHSLSPGNYIPLSVKQELPRMQPSSSLTLVVEVQAAKDLHVHGHEVFRLASCGWTLMSLFDQHNQLRSGHWRVPVRSLPVRPSLSLAQLNSVPQVGNTELWVRLVNGRDGDVQTLTRPDPTRTGLYKYPAVVTLDPAAVHRNSVRPVPDDRQQLCSDLLTDHQPATDEDQSISTA